MKIQMTATALLATAALGGGLALAQETPGQGAAGSQGSAGSQAPAATVNTETAPPQIEGEVVGIDRTNGMVTVRGRDGQTHEFRGNDSTLKDLKVGDRLELTLRQPAR